jgi:hypothetical protein
MPVDHQRQLVGELKRTKLGVITHARGWRLEAVGGRYETACSVGRKNASPYMLDLRELKSA